MACNFLHCLSSQVLFDGGSRGNPGPGGFGFVILAEDGSVVHKECGFMGRCTNNEAGEYLSASWCGSTACMRCVASCMSCVESCTKARLRLYLFFVAPTL